MPTIKNKEWELATAAHLPPMKIVLNAGAAAYNEKTLSLTVTGIKHPHHDYDGYIGDEGKNPALLPVARQAAAIFNEEVTKHLAVHSPMQEARQKYIGKKSPGPMVTDMVGGLLSVQTFNPAPLGQPFEHPVSDADMGKLFDAVAARIAKEIAGLEGQIQKNASLMPKTNPTRAERRKIEKKVGDAWAGSMRVLERGGNMRSRGGSLPQPHEDN